MRMTPQLTTCADSVARTILAHGIETIFALPGIQNDWFFNALHDLGGQVRVVHTRHEQAAGYMALGAALATGTPALYSVVPGPGFLNSTAALATAYSANAPVFCLTGQIATKAIGRGWGLLHEIRDQLEILRTMTKWAERTTDPAEAAGQVAAGFAELLSGRPRPVGLEIPPDLLAARGPFAPAAPLRPVGPPEIDQVALDQAVALLERAENPMIFVGGGAQSAAPLVRRLAERLQAPVVANRMGRGVMDERHPLGLTSLAGHRLWKDCDVALAIGTRLQGALAQWGVDDRLKVIRVDIDREEVDRIHPPAVALIGDAGHILQAMEAALGNRAAPRSREAVIAAVKEAAARELAPLAPQLAWLAAMRDALPEEGVLVDELTQVGYVARVAWPAYHPRSFLTSGFQGTLGWGFAAALGAQVARPDVPVLSISGDGGFMFNVQELATAVHHRIPLTAVVFNDGAYGNVRRMQAEDYGNRLIATELTNPDFIRLAESFGVRAMRATDPDALGRAVRAGIAHDGPVLIEVPVGTMPDPWGLLRLGRVRGSGG
jgi:acetolactate synthase I/II/III large subunit